jgi:hypothetical protein
MSPKKSRKTAGGPPRAAKRLQTRTAAERLEAVAREVASGASLTPEKMRDIRAELTEALSELDRRARAPETAPKPARGMRRRGGGREPEAAAETRARADLAPPPQDVNLRFAEFLDSVGESVVQAQRSLDARSRDYLLETSGVPHASPSLFRMPKLSAQIRSALRQTDEKGLSLVIFKNKTEAEQQHEQTISFEIVSVPPPPGAALQVAPLRWVFFRAARREILKSAERAGLPPDVLEDADALLISDLGDNARLLAYSSDTRTYVATLAADTLVELHNSNQTNPQLAAVCQQQKQAYQQTPNA